MACSGIAEHNEARRKERRQQRLAAQQQERYRMLMEAQDNPSIILGPKPNQSYEQEVDHLRRVGSPPEGQTEVPRCHDKATVDRMRRAQHARDQQYEYSAKLPNRFNSIDYKKQW
ncbi:hypothetical protein KUTeg_001603 [Tegillarca granosa]|uniref:Uncharacterized protein n=1 Tax=Tegillarca granosa TaxID=220873 RepID=A0ABQ9FRX4_TEGGR|nr:hypothetical protein KUTeg_001603 [Tegillarca granosa]